MIHVLVFSTLRVDFSSSSSIFILYAIVWTKKIDVLDDSLKPYINVGLLGYIKTYSSNKFNVNSEFLFSAESTSFVL